MVQGKYEEEEDIESQYRVNMKGKRIEGVSTGEIWRGTVGETVEKLSG